MRGVSNECNISTERERESRVYRLIQGDCLEVMKRIPDGVIDLILTDIPFNISQTNNFKTMKDRQGRNGIDFGEWDKDFNVSSLLCLIPKLKSNGSLVLFHAFEQFSLLKCLFEQDLELKDRLIWEKSNPMPRNRDRRYINNIEMASWFVKKKGKWTFNRQNEKYDTCVLKYPSESGGGYKRFHPCQKNLEMISELVKRHSNPNDLILDPFMGSGTTGVAALQNNRNFIGIELDENYFKIAQQRINNVLEGIHHT